jgi:hypothetical protein
VRTHQHNTSSTLFHTATNLQKSLQSDTKQIKTTIARNLKERLEAKRLHGQFPRRMCGPKRDEVTGEWSKLYNKELNYLYSSPNIIRQIKSRIRWAGHVARMGEERKVYKVLVGKPEGKRSLGRPRRRWEDGIRMDLTEIGWGGVE